MTTIAASEIRSVRCENRLPTSPVTRMVVPVANVVLAGASR